MGKMTDKKLKKDWIEALEKNDLRQGDGALRYLDNEIGE